MKETPEHMKEKVTHTTECVHGDEGTCEHGGEHKKGFGEKMKDAGENIKGKVKEMGEGAKDLVGKKKEKETPDEVRAHEGF